MNSHCLWLAVQYIFPNILQRIMESDIGQFIQKVLNSSKGKDKLFTQKERKQLKATYKTQKDLKNAKVCF